MGETFFAVYSTLSSCTEYWVLVCLKDLVIIKQLLNNLYNLISIVRDVFALTFFILRSWQDISREFFVLAEKDGELSHRLHNSSQQSRIYPAELYVCFVDIFSFVLGQS